MGATENLFDGISPEELAAMSPADLVRKSHEELARRTEEILAEYAAGNHRAASIEVATQRDAKAETAERRRGLNHLLRAEALGEGEYLKRYGRASGGQTLNLDEIHRDLNTGTGSEGGFTVSTEVWGDVGVALEVESEFERRTFQYPGGGSKNVDIPTLATRPSPTWRERTGGNGEGGAITKSNPAFSRKQLSAYDLSVYAAISNELIQDSEADITGFTGAELSRQIMQEKQYAWAVGDDDGMPNGIENAGYTAVALADVGGTLNHTALSRFQFNVPTPYHSNGIWVGSSTILGKLVGLISTTGSPIYSPATGSALPMINGRPFVELPDVTATKLFFGDFRRGYITRVRKDIEIVANTQSDTAFKNNQTLIRGITRLDGEGFITDAVRVLTGV